MHQPSNVSTPYRQNPFDTPPPLSSPPTQEKQDGYFPNVKTRKCHAEPRTLDDR